MNCKVCGGRLTKHGTKKCYKAGKTYRVQMYRCVECGKCRQGEKVK